jgi:hypothetical protein
MRCPEQDLLNIRGKFAAAFSTVVTSPVLHELQIEKKETELSGPLANGLRDSPETWLSGLYTVLGVVTLVMGLPTEEVLRGSEQRLVTEDIV